MGKIACNFRQSFDSYFIIIIHWLMWKHAILPLDKSHELTSECGRLRFDYLASDLSSQYLRSGVRYSSTALRTACV